MSDTEIVETVRRGARSAEEVGACTGAGTDCGSCLGDLACLVAETRVAMATEAGRRRERPSHATEPERIAV